MSGRGVYAAFALAFGLPTAAVGGLFALTMFFFGAVGLTEGDAVGVPMLMAGFGGMWGLAGWSNLSWRYWREGGPALRSAPWWAWFGLAAGCAAALWFLAGAWPDVPKYVAEGPESMALLAATVLPRGPLLLPLALYLAIAAVGAGKRSAAAVNG